MRVKIGNKWFDSNDEPVLIELNNHEKQLIRDMLPSNYLFCCYPTGMEAKKISDWMKDDVVVQPQNSTMGVTDTNPGG